MPPANDTEPGPSEAPTVTERDLAPVLDALQTLERCLEREIRAVTAARPDELLAAVEAKRAALEVVERALRAARLDALLAQAALDANDTPPPRHPPSWPRLLESLGRCRDLNESAGAAIAAAHRNGETALRLLGHAAEPVCYGDDARLAARPGRNLGIC